MVKYSDLTQRHKEIIGNECGPRSRWFKVPNGPFKASCMQHDFYYTRGGDWLDRKWADFEFFYHMTRDAQALDSIFRYWYIFTARVYYLGVRLFGMYFFNYREGYATLKEMIDTIKEKI